MKLKSVALLIFAVFAVVMAAPKVGIEKILAKKELVVGTTGDFPPYSATTKSGELIGMDIDLTRLMADAIGVKQVIKQMPFGELIGALERGEVDIIAAGMSITPARNLKAAFVGPYSISGKSIVSKESFVSDLSNAEQLDKAEYLIVAVEGSTSEKAARALWDSAEIKTVKNFDDALKLVLEGKATGLIADYPYCAVTAYRFQDKGISVPKEPFTFEPIGFAVHKDASHFVNWLENYLLTLDGNGLLESLEERWFNELSWISSLPEPKLD